MKNKMTQLKDKARMAIVAASVALAYAPVYADPSGDTFTTTGVDIKSSLVKILNIMFAFVAIMGAINVLLGIRNLAGGMQDDGGGQDAQKISKGKGQIVSGLIMVAAVSVLQLLGINAQSLTAAMG